MHASTSASTQQPSVGPEHTRHGGEVCPVYRRPDHGSSGEQIPLLVNWYRLECGLWGKTIYIYDIQLFEISCFRGRQRRVPIRGRDKLRILFWNCLRSNPSIFGSSTETIFDDFSKAFTIHRWCLRNDRGNVHFKYNPGDGPGKECSMVIKPLTDLIFDLSSEDDQQRSNSALVTKNLFTQRARYAPEVGNGFWSFVNQWDVCYGSIYRIPRRGDLETSVKVAAGVRAWLGVYNSVKMLEDCTPALAFGLVNRLYYEVEMDLLTFYLDFLEELGLSDERRRNPQLLSNMGMNGAQRRRMTNRLSGLRLMTRKFLSRDRNGRPFLSERRMIFVEVTNHPAQTQMFGDNMTVAETYYRLGEPLEYPYLPLCMVSIGKTKCEQPMEVLFLHEKPQRYTNTMSTIMKMKFIEGVCRKPTLHKRLTEQMFKWMDFENPNMNFLHDFMFNVIPSMISCEGRVLDVPAIVDQDGSKLPMTEKRAIRQKELNEPPSGEIYIAVLIMARHSDRGPVNVCQEEDVGKFYEELIEKCRERGLNIAEEPLVRVYKETDASNFEDYVRDAQERFEKKQDGTERILLLLIINDRDQSYGDYGGAYGLIKSICDNKYGIASQVIDARTLTKAVKSTKKTVYYNIALKINAKLGGVNQAVLFSNETSEAAAKDSVMYVGIDVTHPTSNSGIDISIASMVANFDLAATKYKNEIFAQMKGKETVECFERQFCRLMTKFHEHSKVWPRHIVILRDGVSDSEMLRTAYIELKWIRDSWKKMTGDDLAFDVTYTYIVIQKRHVTRFYQPSKDEKGEDTYVNVPSGTVVDRVVVSPQLFDFFLASQIGAIGTTRPAHYTVVLDEWGLSPDQIYEMCYKLCFLYARCRIPVSLPCPVYYAHVVCEKAKEVYKTLCSERVFDQFPDTMDGRSLKKVEIERRLSAHEHYPGMHFV